MLDLEIESHPQTSMSIHPRIFYLGKMNIPAPWIDATILCRNAFSVRHADQESSQKRQPSDATRRCGSAGQRFATHLYTPRYMFIYIGVSWSRTRLLEVSMNLSLRSILNTSTRHRSFQMDLRYLGFIAHIKWGYTEEIKAFVCTVQILRTTLRS